MSLVEQTFPVFSRQDSFFDSLFGGMTDRMQLEEDTDLIRGRMFHLMPYDDKDVTVTSMEVQRPIIEEKGQAKLHLKFNVENFKPDEIKVKVVGNNLLEVHGEHHEKSDKGEKHQVFMRHYELPKGVDISHLSSNITKDGVLTIEAPAPALTPAERLVPIKYKE